MHDSPRYRDKAAECLLAAQKGSKPYFRELNRTMAVTWIALARQDEAMDSLLEGWDKAEPVRTDHQYSVSPSEFHPQAR